MYCKRTFNFLNNWKDRVVEWQELLSMIDSVFFFSVMVILFIVVSAYKIILFYDKDVF